MKIQESRRSEISPIKWLSTKNASLLHDQSVYPISIIEPRIWLLSPKNIISSTPIPESYFEQQLYAIEIPQEYAWTEKMNYVPPCDLRLPYADWRLDRDWIRSLIWPEPCSWFEGIPDRKTTRSSLNLALALSEGISRPSRVVEAGNGEVCCRMASGAFLLFSCH